MKKILALALCVLMLAGIAVSAVSAEEEYDIDARELQAYGQVHYYAGAPVEAVNAPNTKDGVVSENEYTFSYEYNPNSAAEVVTITDSKTGGYTDTESVKVYVSQDGEYFYMAMEVKDKAYYPNKDVFMINIGARDGGRTIEAVTRCRYDFKGDATKGVLVNDEITTAAGPGWKNDDGSWGTPRPIDSFNDHVGDRSLYWDDERGVLTLEVAFKIQPILTYWSNEKSIEDAVFYFIPLVQMHGDSSEGAGDGPLEQGYLWHYLRSNIDPKLRMAFTLAYPEVSYYMEFFPHIVHFCEAPEETSAPPTSATTVTETQKVTMPPVPATTTAAPTEAPTDAPKADATTAAEKEKGCGSTVALSALAIVPMLGAAVVFGKKKED